MGSVYYIAQFVPLVKFLVEYFILVALFIESFYRMI